MQNDTNKITKRIAKLNDEFRASAGQVFCTVGIMTLPPEDIKAITEKVRLFDDFNEGNDPYGEHDFGSFIHKDEKVYWKIDYKNPSLEYQSKDIAEEDAPNRILTILLSHEY